MNIIAIHTMHDANLAISIQGKIVLILELERIFNERYFESSYDLKVFKIQWSKALVEATKRTGISEFDVAITNWVMPTQIKILQELIRSKTWLKCDHHFAHAALGFFDSYFKNPLILSYDGGGNDGVFNFYNIQNNLITLIDRKLWNFGAAYRLLACLMPELTNNKDQPRGGHMSLSGKLMGYSALGEIIEDWIKPLENYFLFYQYPIQALYSLSNEIGIELEEKCTLNIENARNLAATQQVALQNVVIAQIKTHLNDSYDGIILTGGVALNVLLNTKIKETFKLPVHVPSSPNDCGIAVGSIYALFPPTTKQYITYKGLPLITNTDINRYKGRKYDFKLIANLLVNENAIIGVARECSEAGPRALGNRSIICYPDSIHKKSIINNKIKLREWFRPLAPVIPEEKSELFFGKQIHSPYMSFAYKFTNEFEGKFPAVEHVDGSARIQTVTKIQNEWLYFLLYEIEKLTGYPILLNTSFNTKGKPILTSSNEAFDILNSTELTHVIIENELFYK